VRISRTDAPCLPWTGFCSKKTGHGQQWDPAQKKVRGAHVMAWEEANGMPVPDGMLVRHTCDNPPCRESTHLLLGTHADNFADMMARHPERHYVPRLTNEAHGRHKLTDEQVAQIRAAYTGVRGQKAELARMYGVSKTWVTALLTKGVRLAD
jgi:hypothetical protein